MDNQEAYDKMVVHAFTQKERAMGDGKCVYRAENGNKCFVGALIPDEQYQSWLEGKTASRIMLSVPVLQGLNPNFLLQAQDIHDNDNRNHWFIAFETLASKYELNTDILNQYEGVEL